MRRLLVNRSKRGALLYVPARISGEHENREPDDQSWLDLAILTKSIPLREIGIKARYLLHVVALYLLTRI